MEGFLINEKSSMDKFIMQESKSNKGNKKICLSIAGLDPSGGAGIIADTKTFSAFGCFAAAAITSITFQNTLGVFGQENQSAECVRKQIEPVLDDFKISALKTGMLPSRDMIKEIARIVTENNLENLVVDPVVGSTSGFDLIDDEALSCLVKQLFPLSILVTPNIPEAERITQMRIMTDADIQNAARIMIELGAKNVLITGGHSRDGEGDRGKASDHLFIGMDWKVFDADFIETTGTHGTGCTLSAAITANLALNKGLRDAVGISKDFVRRAIIEAPKIGRGNSPISVREV